MDTIRLPIEQVPNTSPPIFCWKQVVDTPTGKQVVEHRSTVPVTIEVALQRLISVATQLLMTNATLQGEVAGLKEQISNNLQTSTAVHKRKGNS